MQNIDWFLLIYDPIAIDPFIDYIFNASHLNVKVAVGKM